MTPEQRREVVRIKRQIEDARGRLARNLHIAAQGSGAGTVRNGDSAHETFDMTPEQRRNINHVKTLIRNMRAGGREDWQITPWLLSQGWAAGAVKAAMEELGREP